MMLGMLTLWMALEAGYQPLGDLAMYEQARLYSERSFYLEMQARVTIAHTLFVGGEVTTYMSPLSLNNWDPTRMLYQFNAGLRVDGIEVGFRHYCTHPVMTYLPWRRLGRQYWEGAWEQIYARVEIGEK